MTKCTVSSSTARNVGPATRLPTDTKKCGSGPAEPDIFGPHTIPFSIRRYHNDNAPKNLTIGLDRFVVVSVLEDQNNIAR
jgi:hypothetical protein